MAGREEKRIPSEKDSLPAHALEVGTNVQSKGENSKRRDLGSKGEGNRYGMVILNGIGERMRGWRIQLGRGRTLTKKGRNISEDATKDDLQIKLIRVNSKGVERGLKKGRRVRGGSSSCKLGD